MNKILGILLITISFFSSVKSQTFSLTPNRTFTDTATCAGPLLIEAFVKNNGTAPLWLSYSLISNNLPDIACWTQSFCDCNICNMPNVIPNSDDCHGWGANLAAIQPGDSNLIMSVHIDTTNGYFGSGTIKYLVYETGNSSNKDTVTFNILGCLSGAACTTGINENILDQLRIYPTLVNDKLIIENTGEIDHLQSIVIYDLLGKKVHTEKNIEFASNKKIINVSQLAEGVYILNLNENGFSKTIKFIRNN